MLTRTLLVIFVLLQMVAPLAHAHPGHESDIQFHVDIPAHPAPDDHSSAIDADHHVLTAIGMTEAIGQRVVFVALIVLAIFLVLLLRPGRHWQQQGAVRPRVLRQATPPPSRAPPH